MNHFLLRAIALLALLFGATSAHAVASNVCKDPVQTNGYYIDRCGTTTYAAVYTDGACPVTNLMVECLVASVAPTPVSVICTPIAGGGGSCEAWPRPLENGLITYSWSATGGLNVGTPSSSTNPEMTIGCLPNQRGRVTVVVTGPGYVGSTASTILTCNDQ